MVEVRLSVQSGSFRSGRPQFGRANWFGTKASQVEFRLPILRRRSSAGQSARSTRRSGSILAAIIPLICRTFSQPARGELWLPNRAVGGSFPKVHQLFWRITRSGRRERSLENRPAQKRAGSKFTLYIDISEVGGSSPLVPILENYSRG